jgi:hypothetical protein
MRETSTSVNPMQTTPTPVSDSARIRRRIAENNDFFWTVVIFALNAITVALLLNHARASFERYRLGIEIEALSASERRLELEIDRLRVERAWRRENVDLAAQAAEIGMAPTLPARVFVVAPAGGAQ